MAESLMTVIMNVTSLSRLAATARGGGAPAHRRTGACTARLAGDGLAGVVRWCTGTL